MLPWLLCKLPDAKNSFFLFLRASWCCLQRCVSVNREITKWERRRDEDTRLNWFRIFCRQILVLFSEYWLNDCVFLLSSFSFRDLSNQLHQWTCCSSPTQVVCTGLVYSTVKGGQDRCLCDISSNSCVKLWFMDLVPSLFKFRITFCLNSKIGAGRSPLFCCKQWHSDIARIVKHLW